MKVVLTCGHPDSGHQEVHDLLVAAGLAPAEKSRREGRSAAQIHDDLFTACFGDSSGLRVDRGVGVPGKVWQELAGDLVLGNLGRGSWGFADHRAAWLLDFWKEIEPGVRFVLVYSSPEQAVGKLLADGTSDNALLQGQLASWQRVNDELLRFYHRNSDRCVLVEAACAVDAAESLVTQISSAFELDLRMPGEVVKAEAQPSRVASWLARAVTRDDRAVQALYSELESVSDAGSPSADAALANANLFQEYGAMLRACAAREAEACELKRRNEVFGLQIDQLLEEAGIEGRKYAELAQQNFALTEEIRGLSGQIEAFKRAVPPPRSLPVEVLYDFKVPIEGDNWYPAEETGRWAGPGLTSTFKVEPLRSAHIEIEIDVVDAMDPTIVEGLRVSVNGVDIEAVREWPGFPTKVTGRFPAKALPEAAVWEVQLHFPKVISPSELGSADRRRLAIRVDAVRLRRAEAPAGSSH